MTTKKKIQPAKPETKRARKTTAAKAKTASAKTTKKAAKTAAASAKKRAPATGKSPAAKKTAAKTKAPAAKTRKRVAKVEDAPEYRIGEPVLDLIGDVSDGEARTALGEVGAPAEGKFASAEAEERGTSAGVDARTTAGQPPQQAKNVLAGDPGEETGGTSAEVEESAEPVEPAKLERLQKILSQAGVASRRHAEEMIAAGRVMVNGQVVTQLGSKADARRDHIRVDGKLLHGAERHRYFLLNKPRGYVTTVSDPEGRPTVMQFFTKMHERLYPVGRLDFQSEGLLLVTNDGELANLLARAGSGVEKTYLVKVAGQPSEEELERLRGGVAIEKGEPGSERIRTAPARVRQVRAGENPWFEVVLTEGRNRELRKMFAAVGHYAEKIRRVGYGPLGLDVEPGKMRELQPDEVNVLRLTAEGKMKPRRVNADRMLPREAGAPAEQREKAGRWNRTAGRRDEGAKPRPFGEQKRFEARKESGGRKFFGKPRPFEAQGEEREGGFGKKRFERGERPQWKREERGEKREWRPRKPGFGGEGRQPESGRTDRRAEFRGAERQERGERRFEGANQEPTEKRRSFGERKPFAGRKPFGGPRSFGRPKPFEKRDEKRFEGERKPFKPRVDRPQFERGVEGKKRFGGGPGKGFGKSAKFGAKPGGFGGNAKPAFGGKPKFGAKPGGSGGGFRGGSGGGKRFGGAKPGRQRPGAARGGWKRG